MAQAPDGKAAKTEKVTFTRPASERIAKVVRQIEAGNRDGEPLTFRRIGIEAGRYRLKLATFTGNWQIGEYRVVTLQGSTNTANVYNWCTPAVGLATSNTTQNRYVIFGAVGGTQSVVEIQTGVTSTSCTATLTIGSLDLSTLPGYSAGDTQLLGHGSISTNNTCGASLQWYSVTTCSTSTAA